ncbi:MAG: hypothetical protein MUO67_18755 [Anaerolineales bacterium]|nr:hypothetical protein [Anaerolineales bacterium]
MMSDYLDRLAYEMYAKKHHEKLINLSESQRLVRGTQTQPEGDNTGRNIKLGFQPRLVYIMAIIFLATLLITQVVAAALNGNGGGGPYLVR